MAITIPASELARASSVLSPIAKCRMKPILECVLLEATPERVVLTANNLELSAAIVMQNCEVTEPVKTLIRAEKLFRFASNYPKSAISISPNGTKAVVSSESAKLALPTEDVKDFPIRLKPKDRPVTAPAGALAIGTRVTFAADKRESSTRYMLSGVSLIFHGGNLYMAATEGHVLAVQKICESARDDAIYTMPIAAANTLQSIGEGDCEISFANNAIGFRSPQMEFATALLEGRYPNVFSVKCESPDATAIVNRDALIQNLRPMLLVRDGESVTDCYATISNGSLSLSGETQIGKCDSQIPCETNGECRACFDPHFLLESAASFPASRALTLKISKTSHAARLESQEDDYYTHVMDMEDVRRN